MRTGLGRVVCMSLAVGLGLGGFHNVFAQSGYVDRLNEIPTAEQLSTWHEMVASEPHMAGSEGDRQVIEHLRDAFADMGYEVQVHDFYPYLSLPVAGEVEIEHPSIAPGAGRLQLRESVLEEDPYSGWAGGLCQFWQERRF